METHTIMWFVLFILERGGFLKRLGVQRLQCRGWGKDGWAGESGRTRTLVRYLLLQVCVPPLTRTSVSCSHRAGRCVWTGENTRASFTKSSHSPPFPIVSLCPPSTGMSTAHVLGLGGALRASPCFQRPAPSPAAGNLKAPL